MTDKAVKRAVQSTSLNTGDCDPIILNETSTTRFYFEPKMVNNAKNPQACIEGRFVRQRKPVGGKWESYETFECNRLKAGEHVTLPLDTEETLRLIEGLLEYQKIHDELGVPFGKREFVLTEGNVGRVAQQIASLENATDVIEAFKDLNPEKLDNLSTFLGVSRIRKILDIWHENQDNKNENFWQELFNENAWLIAQVLICPVMIFQDKTFVGGTGFDRSGGNIPDFLLQNELTSNVFILEIKTPTTLILGSNYRSTYAIHKDLTGSINQVLKYKQTLLNDFHGLARRSKKRVYAFDPKCIVIIGKVAELEDEIEIEAFELFRNQMKDVEIITFDELFRKTDNLLNLLTEQIRKEDDDDLIF